MYWGLEMAITLRQIRINNFRSIDEAVIDVADNTLFIGKNNTGKSNILIALNLFFNGKTSGQKNLEFSEDHLANKKRARTAREIKISLIFELPELYQKEKKGDSKAYNGVVWTKIWKETRGEIETTETQETTFINDFEKIPKVLPRIPKRSNRERWPLLIRDIRYNYIPTIRDRNYFSTLQGQIYSALSQQPNADFATGREAFDEIVSGSFEEFTQAIRQRLELDVNVKLPKDLKSIFEDLEISTTENDISIDRMGDGIKNRQIPEMLSLLVELEAKQMYHPTHIWAYEEPESTLEMSAAVEFAKSLLREGNCDQLLVTTHSPAFYHEAWEAEEGEIQSICYGVALKETDISSVKLRKQSDGRINEFSTTVKQVTSQYSKMESQNSLDEDIGLTPFIAKKMPELMKELRDLKVEVKKLETRGLPSKPTVLFEGVTDRKYFQRAFELFYPNKVNNIEFRVAENDANEAQGVKQLSHELIAYGHLSQVKDFKRVVGVFDADDAGDKYRCITTKALQEIKASNAVKIMKLQPSIEMTVGGLCVSKFSIEELLSSEFWDYLRDNDKLEKRDYNSALSFLDDEDKGRVLGEESLDAVTSEKPLWVSLNLKSGIDKNPICDVVVNSDAQTAAGYLDGLNRSCKKIINKLGI